MNEKLSHYMNRSSDKLVSCVTSLFGALFLCVTLQGFGIDGNAQDFSRAAALGGSCLQNENVFTCPEVFFSRLNNFNTALSHNLWNSSINAAGLRKDSQTISYAEIYSSYVGGKFKKSYQPDNNWNASAVARTKVSYDKVSMKGGFAFNQYDGRQMCGSMFIEPGYYPVDIYEFTPGSKTLQTYNMSGSIAFDLPKQSKIGSEGWTIGGSINFRSANYAKRKDLRHTNYKMNLLLSPSAIYSFGNNALGFSYLFGKNTEVVKAEQIGSSSGESIFAFLDKGIGFGSLEVWDGSGVHLTEPGVDGFPVREISNGLALQWHLSGKNSFFGLSSSRDNGKNIEILSEFKYIHASFSAGERGFRWFESPKDRISFSTSFVCEKSNGNTIIGRLAAQWQGRRNYENVIEKVSQEGITIPHIRGRNRIFEQKDYLIYFENLYLLKNSRHFFRINYEHRQNLSSTIYPYMTKLNKDFFTAMYETRLFLKAWHLGLSGEWSFGDYHVTDRLAKEGTGVITKRTWLEEITMKDLDYLKSHKVTIGLSARYNLQKSFLQGMYLEADAMWRFAQKKKNIVENYRYSLALKLGYEF